MTKTTRFILEGIAVAMLLTVIIWITHVALQHRQEQKFDFIYEHSRIPDADSTDSI